MGKGIGRWLDRMSVAGAASGAWPRPILNWMRTRVANAPELRRGYDALNQAEHQASGSSVSTSQALSIERALFDTLDRDEAKPFSALKFGVPVLAAAVVVLFFIGNPRALSGDDLSPRSAAGGGLGITVRCLENEGTIRLLGEVSAGPGQPSYTLRCPGDGLLGFAFTNTTKHDMHAFVVGVTEDDAVRWYAPFTRQSESIKVAAGSVDKMVTIVADLSTMESDERVGLRVVFIPNRVQASTFDAVINQAREGRLSPSRLDRLPLRGALEARVELVVTSDMMRGAPH